MSFILPEGTTLQLSTGAGDCNHQNILSSNIQQSEIYPNFPTTSTGSNVGNYNHMGIAGTNNNIWDFLNISGTETGGFNFWTSNSTDAPTLLSNISLDGLTIDKSTSTSSLIALPDITTSGSTFVITATPVNGPPWNINGYGNAVQVYHNTLHLNVGTTYYASGLSPQALQICTNPDGTGILDTSDLSSATQPILGSLGGAPIITTVNSVLSSSNLIITNDNNISNLSKTGLSITDGTNNNVSTQNTISLNNGFLLTNLIEKDKITITDNTNSTQSTYTNNGVTLRDNTASQAMSLNYNRILVANDITAQSVSFSNQYFAFQNQGLNKVFIDALDSPYLTLTDTTSSNSTINPDSIIINSNYNSGNPLWVCDINGNRMLITDNDQGINASFNSAGVQSIDGNKNSILGASYLQIVDSGINKNSILSASDLKFNNVSLVSQVSTNTSNITTLQQNSPSQPPINQLCSPAVYGTSPSLPPQKMFTSTSASNIINLGYNGWYFRNFSTGVNIGWNCNFASSTSKVSDLLQLSFSFITPITTTSPQISVYTSPPTGGNFYNSRRAYVNSGTPTINTPYLYYINFNGYTGIPFKSGHTSVLLTNATVSNVGAFAGTETLYFWSVGTNSIASANTVELIVSSMTYKMNYNSNVIIQPFNFNNSEVISTPQFSNQGTGTRVITPYDYGTQILCTGNVTISGALLRTQDTQFFITCVNAKVPSAPINIIFVGSSGNTTIQLDVNGQLVLEWTGTYWI
jgi:hypothetical protein